MNLKTSVAIQTSFADRQKLLNYANENRINGCFNDVTVQAENQYFPANKMILSCYSTFFEKMFKLEMKERYEKSVLVQGVDARTLELVINYIYTSNLDITDENACDLLAAADFLQIDELTQQCFNYIDEAVAISNCFIFLSAVTLFRNEALQIKIYNYISEHFAEIHQQSSFLHLTIEDLKLCISRLDKSYIKEMMVFEAIVKWTNHHNENRKKHFSDLLQSVDLLQMPREYLEDEVSNEPLIQADLQCSQLVLKAFSELGKMKKELEKQTSKQEKESNLKVEKDNIESDELLNLSDLEKSSSIVQQQQALLEDVLNFRFFESSPIDPFPEVSGSAANASNQTQNDDYYDPLRQGFRENPPPPPQFRGRHFGSPLRHPGHFHHGHPDHFGRPPRGNRHFRAHHHPPHHRHPPHHLPPPHHLHPHHHMRPKR